MITYLKRRFSSGDLQGEAADKREQEGLPSFLRFGSTTTTTAGVSQVQQQQLQQQQPPQQPNQTFQTSALQQQYPYCPQDSTSTGMSQGYVAQTAGAVVPGTGGATADGPSRMPMRGRGAYPSAPSSPTRSYGSAAAGTGSGMGSFMGPMGSITGQISSTIMRGFSTAASTAQSMATGKSTKDRQKVLLVIDDSQTDWSKYFKGRKILGDWEIRVEQPDFVLLRQHASGVNEDWQPILTGLMYSGTPCMNTLHAVYNMKNRPWLFAHLLLLRNRLGKETFPLINQVYYTSHKEMITAPAFPTIIKVGLGHGGEGKIRADNPIAYQDITSLLVSNNLYATSEPFVDAKCDIHVQKIGPHYKAFAFKQWIDEISHMFGGLDICSVEVLQNKAGEYFIYDANGSDMCLFGDSQEDDRREIAELVVQRMQTVCQQSAL
ncbi:unnamed protein product [Echinostoma caproni]|uniref:Synapsin n=1 Tax=Echinostoma caproni TaxID=27848 RepID=A0A183AK16_9TREM|nr:unnamed protein product [Echinostoma caproni]